MWANAGTTRILAVALGLAGAVSMWASCGCAHEPSFPAPLHVRPEGGETVFAFDTNGDKQADFWQYQQPGGRKRAIAYANADGGQPGPRIELDDIAAADCPHFVIALDGVPFELVEELYRDGHFRFFHPPARVICCFPGMTDLALAELFHAGRCQAYQACHFDRESNRLLAGNDAYLIASNSPWVEKMDYRCSFWWDVLVYLDPQTVFNHEMRGIVRTFRKIDEGEGYAYSVGSAGLGTRGGREAILEYLRTVDRLCEQLICERHGHVKLTLVADHGHNLVENRRISFKDVLNAGGYRLGKSIRDAHDVVEIVYGLVTYAEFYTQDPAGVAECLLRHDDVELACYPSADGVIVRDRDGEARVVKGQAGFVYDVKAGDPLRLLPIVEQLRGAGNVSDAGEIDADALFDATLDHYYPDPLARIWCAFHGLVDNPPDLVVNLRDGACRGSRFFHFMIRRVNSTHGSLNRLNSTTFALTTLGELPPAMRSADLLPALEELRGGE